MRHMKIILLRHGKPDIEANHKLSSREYGGWVAEYNAASIDATHLPHEDTINMAKQCNFFVCSDLPRSIDSAKQLGVQEINIIDPMFREFEVPYSSKRLVRLSPGLWTVIYRLLWVMGYSSNSESYATAKNRAEDCLNKLLVYAENYGNVLFIGHGSLLWYITKLLHAQGWSGPKTAPGKYWQYATYTF